MPVEFVGHTGTREGSDIIPPNGPIVDKTYIRTMLHAAEDNNFDRLLLGSFATWPDNTQLAAFLFNETTRLGALMAHRPGFTQPTVAARHLATLDHFSEGRLAVHTITGGTEEDQQRDGDFLDHDTRYARTDEYLDVVKRVWSSDKPFDHEGRFYKFKGAFSTVKPFQQPRVPIYFGGSSDAAIAVAGKHADVYALWGESIEQTRDTIRRVRASAAQYGRADEIRFTLAFRPVVAPTEAAAWARTEEILNKVKEQQKANPKPADAKLAPNAGSVRLREVASQGKIVDKRLWTEFAALTGAQGNSTALVGTPEQVAESLLDYYDIGVTTFLIRGFYPVEDTITYGREVIPLVKAEVARREAARGTQASLAAAG